MDKYEYKLKAEQLLELIGQGAYKKAAELADTIDWRRVRNVSMLMKVSAVYEKNKEYNKSYSVLSLAYRRAEGSRKIISKLCALALKAGKVDEAKEYYDDFVQIAPKDPNKYILKYQILRAEKAPIEQQIEVLEEYKKSEYIEEWAYELAKLYQEAGMTAECLEECDDLILWFSEGKYVYKAMELKMQYKPLTPSQQEKYDRRFDKNSGETEEMPNIAAYVETKQEQESPQEEETQPLDISDDAIDHSEKTSIADQEVKSENLQEEAGQDQSETPQKKKKIGDTMPLDQALRQLLHPKKTEEVQTDQEPELRDLEQEIDEIESVADVDMVKQIAAERKKKMSLPKGEMKEIRPDDEYEIDGQMKLDDILTDWEGTPNLSEENSDSASGEDFSVEEIVEEAEEIVEKLPEEKAEEIVEETAEELREEEAEEIVEETAEELPEEEAEEIVEETAEELPEEEAEEIVEELSEEEAEEIVEETAEELPEEEAEEIVEETAEELPEEEAEEIVEETSEELPEEEAEEIVEETAEELPEEEAEEIVEELPEEEAEETAEELPEEEAEEIAEELPEEEIENIESSEADDTEQENSIAINEGETEGESMDQKTKKIEPILPPDIQRMIDEIEGVIPPQEEEKKPETRIKKADEPLENMGKVADSLRMDEEFDEETGFLDEEEDFDDSEEFWDDEFLDDEEFDEDSFETEEELDDSEDLPEEYEEFDEGEDLPEEYEEFDEGEDLPEEYEEFDEGEDLPEEYEEFDEGEDLPEESEEFDEGEDFLEEEDTEVEDLDEEFRVNPEHANMDDDREIPDDDDDNMDILSATTPLSRKETAKLIATGKTAPLPLDEISDALSMTDTGFIVHGRYDLGIQSGIGTRAGLTEEQKKLFSYFVPVRGMSEQLVDVLEQDKNCTNRKGTSKTGNLLIVGNKGNGKTVLAVDVVKAIQKQRNIHQGKVAIVTGESLNKKRISDIFDKLYGGALIIEKAGKMNEKTVARLNKAMEKDTGELLVVLEEQRKPIDRLLSSNREFRRKFTSRLEVPIFINDELVTFGQTYAQENGYRIDEMGILALYSKIDSLQREDHAVTVAEVKEIMDEAIQHSQKASAKKLVKRVFGKNTDDADRILLSEKDFNI